MPAFDYLVHVQSSEPYLYLSRLSLWLQSSTGAAALCAPCSSQSLRILGAARFFPPVVWRYRSTRRSSDYFSVRQDLFCDR